MNDFDRDPISGLDLEKIYAVADNYSKSCGVVCRVINSMGETLHLSTVGNQSEVCDLAASILPGARNHGQTEKKSTLCSNAHLYGCYQAERFGGQYIYFCPLGLTHWASPLICSDKVAGALIGGPVHMVDPDEFLVDEYVNRHGIPRHLADKLQSKMANVPIIDTDRVNSLSELLYVAASVVSDHSFSNLEQKKKSGDLQAELWDQISFLKNYAFADEEKINYPIDKEAKLLELIEVGDKAGAQAVLNEILGHIFFSSSGSIEIMKARVIELVVLLSRASIRGGADVQQIFGLNYTYLNRINTFRNIDEIAYWLSGIMTRFTDQVFNLTNVKHADVIYRAVDYVKKNYMRKVTLEETAAHVFLSPAYFSRIFKEEMGENFNSYVNLIRIEAAKKLLLNEQVPLVDISSLVGFEGQSYFSKVFKKMTGMTPGRFREARGRNVKNS